jgi:acyl-coenzyme A synthetase/AMP-(fatty) acid ligase
MIYAFQSATGVARDVERLKPAVLVGGAEDLSIEVLEALRANGVAAVALGEMSAEALPGFETSTAKTEVLAAPQIEVLTSGTTGPPKQFAISFETFAGFVAGDNAALPASGAGSGTQAPIYLCKPIGNIAGLLSTLPPLLRGEPAVLMDRFQLNEWLDYVRRYRPERAGMPATGVQMVLDAQVPPADLASLRSLATGASPLDPTVQGRFERTYGIPILLAYGATEFAGPVAAMTPALAAEWGKKKLGSVGRALGDCRLQVVDASTGEAVAAGREGVLEVLAPRVGPDWIRTSDIAVLDADGFLFIRGRSDGAIMRGGFKILPETIERGLMLHDAVAAVGVVGLPDQRLGQVPAAAIQLKPGVAAPTTQELEAHLRRHVLATHIPTVWRIVDALPLTSSFKVDRPALQRLLTAQPAPGEDLGGAMR